MLSFCILGVLTALYAALFLYFSVGLLRAKKDKEKPDSAKKTVAEPVRKKAAKAKPAKKPGRKRKIKKTSPEIKNINVQEHIS